jgi:hypothetical protein
MLVVLEVAMAKPIKQKKTPEEFLQLALAAANRGVAALKTAITLSQWHGVHVAKAEEAKRLFGEAISYIEQAEQAAENGPSPT